MMNETYAPTVTITVDEYFDLRQKAEVNAYLVAELTRLECSQNDINNRLMDIEQKMLAREYAEKGRYRRADNE